MHPGFIIQVMGCLMFVAYVAMLNIIGEFSQSRKDVRYRWYTIVGILLMAGFSTDYLSDWIGFDELGDSIFVLIITLVTVTIVFMHERTLKTIGLSLNGVKKSAFVGLLVGFGECVFYNNLNICGEMASVSDIAAGEVILMAPLFEEVFFRGFLYRYFRLKKWSRFKSIVVSSLIWTLLHGYNFNILFFLFFSGILLGYVKVKTKSLAGPMVMHFVWNFFVL